MKKKFFVVARSGTCDIICSRLVNFFLLLLLLLLMFYINLSIIFGDKRLYKNVLTRDIEFFEHPPEEDYWQVMTFESLDKAWDFVDKYYPDPKTPIYVSEKLNS